MEHSWGPRERAGYRIELRSVLVGHLRRADENYQIDRLLYRV